MAPALSIEIARLRTGSEDLAREAIEAAGQASADPNRMAYLLERDDCFFIAAVEGGKPVGFILAYVFQRVNGAAPAMLFCDAGVVESHRRHGIARVLLTHLKAICRQMGASKIIAATDASDEGAVKFLESTGAERDGGGEGLFVYGPNALR